MIVAAFDPGLHHIVWTVTEWTDSDYKTSPPCMERVIQVGVLETDPKTRELSMGGALNTIGMLRTSSLTTMIGPVDKIVIETQHTKNPKIKKDDIRDLAVVTGALACVLSAEAEVVWAPTGPKGWSNLNKDIRHNRLLGHYSVGYEFSTAPVVGALKGRKKLTKRMSGDALDTIGMALWYVLGKPRAGI